MQAVGFWIAGLNDDRRPAPQEIVGQMPTQDRLRLIDYLRAGRIYASYLGYSWCRFGCGVQDQRMGSRDLTDGSWVWPEGLAHYVSEHGITLPEQFVKHALRSVPRDRQAGDLTHQGTVLHDEQVDVSDAEWIQWASTRRWSQVLERLKEGQRSAAAFYKAKRIEEIGQLEKVHGLSPDRCVWRDCPKHALAQKHICAEHFFDTSAIRSLSYDLRAAEELHAILRDLTQAHGQIAHFRGAGGPRAQRADGERRGGKLRRLLSWVLRN